MDKRQRLTLLGIAAAIAVVAVVVALVAGGGDDDSGTSTTTPTNAADTKPTQAGSAPAPAKPAAEQISIAGGQPDGGVKKITVDKNDPLQIVVTSDQELPIHFHGYDIEKDAGPGKPATFKLTKANIDGVFEMEIESTKTKIASITVKP